MPPRHAARFYRVGTILDAFRSAGCEVRVAEATVMSPDGDVWNVRYVIDPETDAFVPLVDLDDDHQVSEGEVRTWERRLGHKVV